MKKEKYLNKQEMFNHTEKKTKPTVSSRADTRKSQVINKVSILNTKAVQLPNLKNSSKSTPMMSFKSINEEINTHQGLKEIIKEVNAEKEFDKINDRDKDKDRQKDKDKERDKNKREININLNTYNTNTNGAPIKVNKKSCSNKTNRKSLTGKEDYIGSYKLNYTPDIKPPLMKNTANDIKSKTSSGFRIKSENFAPSKFNQSPTIKNGVTINSNYVLSTNHSDKDDINIVLPGYIATNPKDNYNNCMPIPPIQSDIVSTIQNLGTLLKAQTSHYGTSENEKEKIENLNMLIKKVDIVEPVFSSGNGNEEQPDSILKFHINDSRNLLMDNNVIRRDTFIDNNLNKKMQNNEKHVVINEIYGNSNNRIKKYEILFDFINNNLKEINDMVIHNNKKQNSEDENLIFNKEIVKNINEEKILLNTNANNSNVSIALAVCNGISNGYNHNPINSGKAHNFCIGPVPGSNIPNLNLNNNTLLINNGINLHYNDVSQNNPFFNLSVSDLDFYKQLADQTMNIHNDNISNEMSTMRTKHNPDISVSNLNDKMDKTKCQYDDYDLKKGNVNYYTNYNNVNTTMKLSQCSIKIPIERDSNINEKTDTRVNINPHMLLKQIKEKQTSSFKSQLDNCNKIEPSSNPVTPTLPEEKSKCVIF